MNIVDEKRKLPQREINIVCTRERFRFKEGERNTGSTDKQEPCPYPSDNKNAVIRMYIFVICRAVRVQR